MRSRYILLCCLCVIFTGSLAQEKKRTPFAIGVNYHFGGKIGRFNAEQEGVLLKNKPFAIEVEMRRIAIGNRRWERHWRYPVLGLSLTYYDFDMPIVGRSVSLSPFVELFVIRRPKWAFSISPSLGLAYHTTIYDSVSNPGNNAISTHITASFFNDFKLKYNISSHFTAHACFSFRHFSNGAVLLPNAGMNFLLWGVGVSYQPTPFYPNKVRDTVHLLPKRIKFNVEAGTNRKGIDRGERHIYQFYVLSMYVSKRVSKINSMVVGIDIYKDESIYYELVKRDIPAEKDKVNTFSFVANIGTELFLGKISYTPQFGWYLYQYANLYGSFVHRHTFKYYFCDYFYIKGTLKVFSFAADSFDYGLGFRF